MSRKKTSIDANFSIRLKDLIENKLQIKRAEFIKNVGISQGYLGMVLLGKRGPSAELVAGLFSHYRGYLHWILTGEEETTCERQNVDSLGILGVREPEMAYGTDVSAFAGPPARRTPSAGETADRSTFAALGPAVDLLANILNSGDQVIVQALMANLHAFNRAVEKDKAQLGRIQELEEKCRALEERAHVIEQRQIIEVKREAA